MKLRGRLRLLVAQLAPQDLADVGFRQLVAELDELRLLVRRQLVLAVVQQLLGRQVRICLLYTSPSPRDRTRSRMPSSA